MNSAVATTSGTMGNAMASGLAAGCGRRRAQHLAPLEPAPRDLAGDGLGRVEQRILPGLEPLETLRHRPRGPVIAQRLVKARELNRAALGLEHIDGLARGARLARHVDGVRR